ncbi:hypothetical protein ABCW43_14830 [Neorhizobium sp. IRAMC:178]|uniref:hypothetical protein n=1 Tax=Neorhizobium tunisiense TaxID=3144793 RepID=UPI0031F651F8
MEPERRQPIDNAANFALARQAHLNVLRQLDRGKFKRRGLPSKSGAAIYLRHKGDLVVPRNQSNRTFGVLSNDDPVFQ